MLFGISVKMVYTDTQHSTCKVTNSNHMSRDVSLFSKSVFYWAALDQPVIPPNLYSILC